MLSSWESLVAVTAARRHLVEGVPLTAIAAELGVSRFKAGRLVQHAREAGWVRIEVTPPPGIETDLSRRLAERTAELGVRRALVTTEAAGRDALDRAAAEAVEAITGAGDVLGLACGRTVNRVVAAIRRLPRCAIVQLTGLAAPLGVRDSSVETVRRAAHLSGHGALPVYEPMLQPSARVAAARLGHPALSQAFARWEHLTVALITVGAWERGLSNVFDSPGLDEADRVRTTQAGAVAEICGHLLDGGGHVLCGDDVTARCLAVPWERLRDAREVIAIAADPARSHAVVAALLSGVVSTLVTGEETALALLELL